MCDGSRWPRDAGLHRIGTSGSRLLVQFVLSSCRCSGRESSVAMYLIDRSRPEALSYSLFSRVDEGQKVDEGPVLEPTHAQRSLAMRRGVYFDPGNRPGPGLAGPLSTWLGPPGQKQPRLIPGNRPGPGLSGPLSTWLGPPGHAHLFTISSKVSSISLSSTAVSRRASSPCVLALRLPVRS